MENLNLIREITWSFAKKTNHDWDELFSVAALNYAEAINSYNPNCNTKFSTYAYTVMRNGLVNYCKQEQSRSEHQVRMPDDFDHPGQSKTEVALDKVTANWANTCKDVVGLIMDNFDELDGMPPKLARGAIVRELRQQGWKWHRIWATMQQVKELMKEAQFTY